MQPTPPAEFGASPIHPRQAPEPHAPSSHVAKRYAKWAALVGALVYLVALLSHALVAGGIRQRLGCVVPLEYHVLNLPAQLTHALLPNPWLFPQEFGEPPIAPFALTTHWNPMLWVLHGVGFWIVCLGCLGYGIGRLRELASQRAPQASPQA